MSNELSTNNYVERVSKMSDKASMNEAKKAMANVKLNSVKLSVVISHILDNKFMSNIDLAEELGLSTSTTAKMKKAGEFYESHPDMLDIEYSKAYLLGKLEDKDVELTDEVIAKPQSELQKMNKEAKESNGSEETDAAVTEETDAAVTENATNEITEDKIFMDVLCQLMDCIIHGTDITDEACSYIYDHEEEIYKRASYTIYINCHEDEDRYIAYHTTLLNVLNGVFDVE